ncbi:MAG: hypothetical protein IPJ65_30725 [Archangiaceae bacterium]|nr:hypothetical protein [Archangiaceae bacterium]
MLNVRAALLAALVLASCGIPDGAEAPEADPTSSAEQPLVNWYGCGTYSQLHDHAEWLCAIRGRGQLKWFSPHHDECGGRYGSFRYTCTGELTVREAFSAGLLAVR